MDYRLIISDSAQREIDNAIEYVAVKLGNPGAAGAILSDIGCAYELMRTIPESLPLCSDPLLFRNEFHKALLKKHNYVLIFRIDGDTVKIYGFFHTLENYIEKIL